MLLHQGMLGLSAARGIHALILDAVPLVHAPPPGAGGGRRRRPCGFEVGSPSRTPAPAGPAHDGINFAVAAGERVATWGSSGSGKSSVARLILRLYDPQQGRVLVGGRDVRELLADDAAPPRGRREPGHIPVPRDRRGQPADGPAGRDAGGAGGRRARGQRPRLHRGAAHSGTRPSWASGASACPVVSGSASRSPAPCCATPPSWSSTRHSRLDADNEVAIRDARTGDRGPYHPRRRAPAVECGRCGPDPRARRRARRRERHACGAPGGRRRLS